MDYASARDLFEAAREAAVECERTRRMLQEMEAGEGVAGGGLGMRVSRGSTSDPMRRTDARIDHENVWRRRIAEDERLMDYATSVLYGAEQDGRGGVDALLGTAYADILWWRYLAAAPWAVVARMVDYSVRRCAELHAVALDFVDANGIRATIAGVRDGMSD